MDLENEFLLETELSWKAQSQAVCTLEYWPFKSTNNNIPSNWDLY